MAGTLEVGEPVEDVGEAEMHVRRGRIDPELDAQGPAQLELLLETALWQDVDGVAGELFDGHSRARLPRFWRSFGETHGGRVVGGSASSDSSPSSSFSGFWARRRSPSVC